MAARSKWKGYMKLSLVSCPVLLYPAVSTSSRVKFNTLNRKTGNKVKRQFVDPETLEEVEIDDQVKGYAVGKNSFVLVEEDELDELRIESTHTIDIDSFVFRNDVDERYFETPYYIAPEDKVGLEAFAVIRDAMRDKGMAGIARVVIARRERIILVEPFEKGLVGTVLRYQYEVRDATPYFEDIPDLELPGEMMELAEHIIDRRSGLFDPSKFEDRYEKAMVALLKAKQTGQPVTFEAVPRPTNVVSLMDALRRSLSAEKEESATATKRAPSKPRGATVPIGGRARKKKA